MGVSDEDRRTQVRGTIYRVSSRNRVEVKISKDHRSSIAFFGVDHSSYASSKITLKGDLKELRERLERINALDHVRPKKATLEVPSKQAPAPKYSSRLHALFLPYQYREAALGDREEFFQRDVAKHGHSWAVWLYRWDTFVAMCSWLKRMASFSAIAGMGGAFLKWLGSGG